MITVISNNEELRYEIINTIRIFYRNAPVDFMVSDNINGFNIEKYGFDVNLKIYVDRDNKESILMNIFLALSKLTGIDPPYGRLTGVRPAKICSEMKKTGFTDDQILKRLKNDYYVSDEKIGLLLDVSTLEKEIIEGYGADDISIYIGIPFCPSKCRYCSFPSYSIDRFKETADRYIDALCHEMEYIHRNMILSRKFVKTIYIGGGTPTSLSCFQLERLLKRIGEIFDLSKVLEYTLEAGRPDTLNDNKFKIMRDHGVKRISINPQTMNDETLKLIGRAHKSEDVYRAFEAARKNGFYDINMDVIIGLPNENSHIFEKTMDKIYGLDPESITVHNLAIKKASDFNSDFLTEEFTTGLPSNDQIFEMSDIAARYARLMKMRPYYLYRQKNISGNLENIGYAKPGRECAYNILIMEEVQSILAFGAGAVSKFLYKEENRIERAFNVKDPLLYIQRIDEMCNRKMNFISAF